MSEWCPPAVSALLCLFSHFQFSDILLTEELCHFPPLLSTCKNSEEFPFSPPYCCRLSLHSLFTSVAVHSNLRYTPSPKLQGAALVEVFCFKVLARQ